jgi:hypothetical protein
VDERIRMDTAGGSDGQQRRTGAPRPAVMVIVAAAVTAFGLLTTLSPDRDALEPETIDPGALVEPEIDAGFRVVAELRHGPWESHRIAGAYLFVGDAPTIIADDDTVFEIDLDQVEVVFGAISVGGESLAFGRTPESPAVWRSDDNVDWALETLPWDGTVRAAAEIDGRLVLIGIARNGPAFTYVVANEAPGGWLVVETTQVPDSGLISVPGGFVGRGSATDGSGYGYLYSDDGSDWTWQSDRAAGGSRSPGQIPGFVVETDAATLLSLPGDERVFEPPAWPISGLWVEDDTIWVQTPNSAWASLDGVEWQEYPINAETGVDGGYSVLLPVGETARLATSVDDRIHLLRWDPGSG